MKLLALLFCATAFAADIPKVKFTDTFLENGSPRHHRGRPLRGPFYAINISYKVGSKDERKGRTGFAHLFEHMMFKGSEKRGRRRVGLPHLHQRRQF